MRARAWRRGFFDHNHHGVRSKGTLGMDVGRSIRHRMRVHRWARSGLLDHDGTNDLYLACSTSGIGSTRVTARIRTSIRGRVRVRISVGVGVAAGLGSRVSLVRIVRGTSGNASDVASGVSVRVGVSVRAGLRATVTSVTWPITIVNTITVGIAAVIASMIATYVESVWLVNVPMMMTLD